MGLTDSMITSNIQVKVLYTDLICIQVGGLKEVNEGLGTSILIKLFLFVTFGDFNGNGWFYYLVLLRSWTLLSVLNHSGSFYSYLFPFYVSINKNM